MLIETQSMTRRFVVGDIETTALNQVDFHVKEGEFVAVMGSSGCGKSTLLNILGLLDPGFGGSYRFKGQETNAFTSSQRSIMRSNNISFVFQNFNLIGHLTVFDNIELSLIYKGHSKIDRAHLVGQAMERVGISHRENHLPTLLSGGEQQRVALARAIVSEPNLILADEPTGNLDAKKGEQIMELLTSMKNAGTSIVMVTHSQNQAQYVDRIVELDGGKLV
jgi:putative ABC transport system ATP-binding protein